MTETQKSAPGREYETIYVLRPDVSKEGAEKVSNRVAEVMQRGGGTLTQVESWGRRALAFPVSNYRRAYYIYLKYVGGGEVVSELERNFRMLDSVLKYQTVKLRDEIDVATVEINPEDVEFEAIEPPAEEEAEETLAEQLGLQDPPQREPRGGEAYGEGRGDARPAEGRGDARAEAAVAEAPEGATAGAEETPAGDAGESKEDAQ